MTLRIGGTESANSHTHLTSLLYHCLLQSMESNQPSTPARRARGPPSPIRSGAIRITSLDDAESDSASARGRRHRSPSPDMGPPGVTSAESDELRLQLVQMQAKLMDMQSQLANNATATTMTLASRVQSREYWSTRIDESIKYPCHAHGKSSQRSATCTKESG